MPNLLFWQENYVFRILLLLLVSEGATSVILITQVAKCSYLYKKEYTLK